MITLTLSTARIIEAAKYISYNPDSGLFSWKSDRNHRTKAGSIAGHVRKDGYIGINANGVHCYAHRLAYFIVTGVNPSGDIDHINGDKSDNRFTNLRVATRSQNRQNVRRAQVNNESSGLLGVSETRGRWQARIMLNKTSLHIGCFSTAEEAHAAYLTAKREIHSHCEI